MKAIYLVPLALVFLAGCAGTPPVEPSVPPVEPPAPLAPAPAPAPEEYEIKTDASGTKYIVEPYKIVGGGPPKDGIPSIDSPKFVPLDEADRWIEDNELVLGFIHRGIKRVYPLQILVWHEIVNETIAGDPLLVTY